MCVPVKMEQENISAVLLVFVKVLQET